MSLRRSFGGDLPLVTLRKIGVDCDLRASCTIENMPNFRRWVPVDFRDTAASAPRAQGKNMSTTSPVTNVPTCWGTRYVARFIAVSLIGITPFAHGVLGNPGFESGAAGTVPATPWSVSSYINNGIANYPPTTFSDLGLQPGGKSLTVIVAAAAGPQTQDDPDLGSTAQFRWPLYGNQSLRLNQHSSTNYTTGGTTNGQNVNVLSQTEVITSGDVDPSDGLFHVRLTLAPVLQNPVHPATQQPYVFVEIDNLTTGVQLFNAFYASQQTSQPWQAINAGTTNEIDYLPQQLIDISPGSPGLELGDQVKVTLVAAGCSPGGHEGFAYIDNAGGPIVGAALVSGPPGTVTYRYSYENLAATPIAGTEIEVPSPLDSGASPLTFNSVSSPGLICVPPSVGTAGTTICTLPGTLASGGSGSFEVSFNPPASSTPVEIIQNAYSIEATAFGPVLGPPMISYTQIITFPNPGPITQTTMPFALGATSTSDLAVSYVSNTSSVCTVLGTSVTVISVGTCSITASQTGNADFVAAAPVTDLITIKLLSQSITFPNPGPQTYSAAGTFALGATASSGLTVAYASNSTNVCTVAGTTASIVSVGNCSITASQPGNGNYDSANPVTISIPINLATQSVAFTSSLASAFVHGPTYAVSATSTSGLPVTLAIDATATSVCSISGTTVSFSAIGNCVIDAFQNGNTNYSPATLVQQQIPVTFGPATTLVTTGPHDILAGSPIGTLSAVEEDSYGNVIDVADSVTFAVGGCVIGSTSMTNGTATLGSAMRLYVVASNETVTATTGALAGTSSPFNVLTNPELIFNSTFEGCIP
jgi:hypothetical protein